MTRRGAVDVLGRVDRFGQGDALAPPFGVGPDDPDQQDVPIGLGPERGLEGSDQIQPDAAKLHLLDLHPSASSSSAPGENIPTVAADGAGHESGTPWLHPSCPPGPPARPGPCPGSAVRIATMSAGTWQSTRARADGRPARLSVATAGRVVRVRRRAEHGATARPPRVGGLDATHRRSAATARGASRSHRTAQRSLRSPALIPSSISP